MSNGYIGVTEGSGKNLQTYLNTIAATDVHAEAVVLVDTDGNPIATLNVNASGNINANFVGPVTVQSSNAANFLSTVAGTVTATQSNASNFLATISGTVIATGPITNAQLRASEVSISATNLPLPALASTSTKQSDGTQKTQVVDPTNASNVAGITAGALNVYLASVTVNAGTNLNTANVSVKAFTGAPNLASGQVAATNVSSTLVAARTLRRSASLRNLDSTNSGYVGPAPIGTANGMLLQPKESISVDYTGVIAVITASGNANFAYLETYD